MPYASKMIPLIKSVLLSELQTKLFYFKNQEALNPRRYRNTKYTKCRSLNHEFGDDRAGETGGGDFEAVRFGLDEKLLFAVSAVTAV